jgi:hypothetical protein
MPSGYTCGIEKGITFKEFALGCARAFGALIDLRDAPYDTEIPDVIEPHISFYQESLKKDEEELEQLLNKNKEEIKEGWLKHCEEVKKDNEERLQKVKALTEKYEYMLEKARAYIPPTSDHIKYKEFMISQIKESMEFDCVAYNSVYPKTTLEYYEGKINTLQHSIEYDKKAIAEEIERAKSRTDWIQALKKSLAEEES